MEKIKKFEQMVEKTVKWVKDSDEADATISVLVLAIKNTAGQENLTSTTAQFASEMHCKIALCAAVGTIKSIAERAGDKSMVVEMEQLLEELTERFDLKKKGEEMSVATVN